MFELCVVLLFPVQSGCFFYTFPEHVLIPSCFNGNPDHTLPFHKEFSGIDLEYFFEVFYLFIRIFLMFYSVVYLVKFGCIFLYFDLIIPVDDTVSDLYIVYIRKSCFFQSLLCVVNDALKGMMYIFHFPFPEQFLFQAVPADTFFRSCISICIIEANCVSPTFLPNRDFPSYIMEKLPNVLTCNIFSLISL